MSGLRWFCAQSYAPPGVAGERPTGPYAPPAITTHSDERALRVAERLQVGMSNDSLESAATSRHGLTNT